VDEIIVTLATITFISLLLFEFDTGLLAYEKEQEKKIEYMINSKQQNTDIGPFSIKPQNFG
jgi:hypothetical protein